MRPAFRSTLENQLCRVPIAPGPDVVNERLSNGQESETFWIYTCEGASLALIRVYETVCVVNFGETVSIPDPTVLFPFTTNGEGPVKMFSSAGRFTAQKNQTNGCSVPPVD